MGAPGAAAGICLADRLNFSAPGAPIRPLETSQPPAHPYYPFKLLSPRRTHTTPLNFSARCEHRAAARQIPAAAPAANTASVVSCHVRLVLLRARLHAVCTLVVPCGCERHRLDGATLATSPAVHACMQVRCCLTLMARICLTWGFLNASSANVSCVPAKSCLKTRPQVQVTANNNVISVE